MTRSPLRELVGRLAETSTIDLEDVALVRLTGRGGRGDGERALNEFGLSYGRRVRRPRSAEVTQQLASG
jgi:hypothetical protein